MSRFAPAVPLLGLILLGCSGPSVALPADMATQPSVSSPASTTPPPSAATPQSPSTTDLHACYEAQCELTVSGPVRFPVDPRLGFDTISVSRVGEYTVSIQATGPGKRSRSTVSQGSTWWFNGLELRVLRISHGTAVLQFLR
jgi:hypothetical protein